MADRTWCEIETNGGRRPGYIKDFLLDKNKFVVRQITDQGNPDIDCHTGLEQIDFDVAPPSRDVSDGEDKQDSGSSGTLSGGLPYSCSKTPDGWFGFADDYESKLTSKFDTKKDLYEEYSVAKSSGKTVDDQKHYRLLYFADALPGNDKPFYCKNTDDGWAGFNQELEEITEEFDKKSELYESVEAETSTSEKVDGEKYYKLIYPADSLN